MRGGYESARMIRTFLTRMSKGVLQRKESESGAWRIDFDVRRQTGPMSIASLRLSKKGGVVTRRRLIDTPAGVARAVGGNSDHQVCRECGSLCVLESEDVAVV